MEAKWKPTKEETKELLDTPLGQVLNGLETFMIEKNTELLTITLSSKKIKFDITGTPIVKTKRSKSNNN